jgi:UDP-N-acetylmuramoylalanine--D-glutamate ligase
MIKLSKQKGKKIGIYGLGITGLSVFNALENIASEILCFDDNPKNFADIPQANIVNLDDTRWQNLDFIVLSPGIPLTYPAPHPIVSMAREYKIEILCDIDLLYEEYPDAIYIGITGTNGKSTTCALLHHILEDSGKFQLGGNIGVACLSLNPPAEEGGYILELSSYQLDLIQKLRLNYAAITNITPDHLDRHGSFGEYVKAKIKILQIGKEQCLAIINLDDKILQGCRRDYNTLFYSAYNQKRIVITNPSLQGNHNAENAAAAISLASLLGVEEEISQEKIESFSGLPHRMEFLGTVGHIAFYNDSKATNIESALKSILALKNIYLLAGGISKEGEGLSRIEEGDVRHLYLFGRDKQLFAKALKDRISFTIFDNMEEAFSQALIDAKKSNEDCTILLAPACASTDQFKNFEERGQKFREWVNLL